MFPHDFGPIYSETDMSRLPVEPWNTFSNLIFLFIILNFAIRTGLDWQKHRFIVSCLPVLLIGFAGGTIYHGTRSHNIWLFLDFIPIMLLALSASIYFLTELTKKWLLSCLLVAGTFTLMGLARRSLELPRFLSIALGYGFLAGLIIIPMLIVAKRDKWRNVSLIISALLIFSLALYFRTIDSTIGKAILPMGTHFLWHLLGGTAVFLLFQFMYRRDCLHFSETLQNSKQLVQ
jgi:Ceramidase